MLKLKTKNTDTIYKPERYIASAHSPQTSLPGPALRARGRRPPGKLYLHCHPAK